MNLLHISATLLLLSSCCPSLTISFPPFSPQMFLYDALLSVTRCRRFDAFTLDDIDHAFVVAEAGGPMHQVRYQQEVDIKYALVGVVLLLRLLFPPPLLVSCCASLGRKRWMFTRRALQRSCDIHPPRASVSCGLS